MTENSAHAQNPNSRWHSILAALCLLAFCGTLYWLARAKWPLGVANEWQMKPNAGPWPLPAWGLPLAVFFIFGGLAALSTYDRFKRAKNEKEKRASTRLCILALSIVAFAWPWALLGPGGTSNLIASQWSDVSNEYFGTSYQIENARTFTREYAQKWQTPQSRLQSHTATHPPGAVVFYYFARRFYESSPAISSVFSGLAASLTGESVETLATQSNTMRISAERSASVPNPDPELPASAVGAAMWCAFLISLLLASCVPATYFIASISSAAWSTPDANNDNHPPTPDSRPLAPDMDEARGMTAAAFFALAPGVSLFAFSLDALIACGAAWTMAFVALRLRGGKPLWLLVSGAAMALTSFVSFGALAIAAIAIIALLFARRRAAIREITFFIGGFFAAWLCFTLFFQFNPLEVFRNAMAAHQSATVESRSRGAWIGMNILCYAVFCGWPLFFAACAGGLQFAREFGRDLKRQKLRAAFATTPVIIGSAALLTMILLTLSGAAKGEVERLWLFLTPLLACLAATCAQREKLPSIGVLLFLQAAQTLIMSAWLAPLIRPL